MKLSSVTAVARAWAASCGSPACAAGAVTGQSEGGAVLAETGLAFSVGNRWARTSHRTDYGGRNRVPAGTGYSRGGG